MNTELKQRKTTVRGDRKRARPTERSQPEEVMLPFGFLLYLLRFQSLSSEGYKMVFSLEGT